MDIPVTQFEHHFLQNRKFAAGRFTVLLRRVHRSSLYVRNSEPKAGRTNDGLCGVGVGGEDLGDAKVSKLDDAILAAEDVVGLQVAVDDALRPTFLSSSSIIAHLFLLRANLRSVQIPSSTAQQRPFLISSLMHRVNIFSACNPQQTMQRLANLTQDTSAATTTIVQ